MKFFKYVPEQHDCRGIITPIDHSFGDSFLRSFVQNHVLGPGVWERDAVQAISSIINPVQTLMQKTKVPPAFSPALSPA